MFFCLLLSSSEGTLEHTLVWSGVSLLFNVHSGRLREREESFIQVFLGRAEQRQFLSLWNRHTVLFLCLIFMLKICFLCDFFNAQLGIEGIL